MKLCPRCSHSNENRRRYCGRCLEPLKSTGKMAPPLSAKQAERLGKEIDEIRDRRTLSLIHEQVKSVRNPALARSLNKSVVGV